MIELTHFRPQHGRAIHEQSATAYLRPMLAEQHYEALAQQAHSYTVLRDGKVIACMGVVGHWPGRGEAWAMLDAAMPHDFLAIHHLARRFLRVGVFRRVEAVVETGFEAGHRWARALGFELEAPRMAGYGPDGRDYSLYARVG